MSEQRVEGRSVDFLKREKITTPFRFGAPCLVCKRNHNSSSAPGWSGLVAIVSALAPASWAVVVALGVGTMVACVPYYCAAV